MALGSKSHFFFQSLEILEKAKSEMIETLYERGFVDEEILFYIDSFDYFVKNPSHYDGATATEDLYDIPGLEFDSMDHDSDYVQFNVSGSFKYMRLSDKMLLKKMNRNFKSSFERNWRRVRLWALRYIALYPLWSGRKMSKADKKYMDEKAKVFL